MSDLNHGSPFSFESLTLAAKLEYAQAQHARFAALAKSPNLSAQAAWAAQSLARSYAAAVSLCQGAIEYEAKENDRAAQSALMRSLGITPLDG
ncbi:MAG: hypothetical protein WAV27_09835 [Xanthobacteraceae bacterium]